MNPPSKLTSHNESQDTRLLGLAPLDVSRRRRPSARKASWCLLKNPSTRRARVEEAQRLPESDTIHFSQGQGEQGFARRRNLVRRTSQFEARRRDCGKRSFLSGNQSGARTAHNQISGWRARNASGSSYHVAPRLDVASVPCLNFIRGFCVVAIGRPSESASSAPRVGSVLSLFQPR